MAGKHGTKVHRKERHINDQGDIRYEGKEIHRSTKKKQYQQENQSG